MCRSVACCHGYVIVGLLVGSLLPVHCHLDSSEETGSAAVWFVCAVFSHCLRPVAAEVVVRFAVNLLSLGGQRLL
ncbi:hypothetical protein, partial [Neptuniibacter sp.]|uniref:hypothetical protein n=1 Tax=Neptuniibacter sp. TaxID=1962643 RepID=UPI00262F18E1